MSDWNFFEYIVVNTVNNSKEIEGFKENMKAVGIKNYQIRSGESVAKSNKSNNSNKCNTFNKIFYGSEECCGDICKDVTKRHYELIKDAYEKGANNIFFFEDDARFELPFNFKKLARIVEWLKKNKNWEAFYFGYQLHPNPLIIPFSLDIGKLFDPMLTHAVVFHRRAMKKFLDNIKEKGYPKIQTDQFWRDLLKYKYGSLPAMNYQCKDIALQIEIMKKLQKILV